jgi:predicted nucleic acid-binding protein
MAMLIDTSVWVEHLRRGDPTLSALLGRGEVECHPFVIGELACGSLRRRAEVLGLLQKLPHVAVADHDEVLAFIERRRLMARGIGWIDAHLLASAALSNTLLWSRDRRLSQVARELHLCAVP